MGRVWKFICGGGGGGDRVVVGYGLGIRRVLVVGCKEWGREGDKGMDYSVLWIVEGVRGKNWVLGWNGVCDVVVVDRVDGGLFDDYDECVEYSVFGDYVKCFGYGWGVGSDVGWVERG